MGPDQARRNPYAHLLTPCLGLEEPPIRRCLLASPLLTIPTCFAQTA